MDEEARVMRQQIDATLADLTEKLDELERRVSTKVRNVRDSVSEVRDRFDLKLHVRRRPWTVLAGATALAFVAGVRSNHHSARQRVRSGTKAGAPLALAAAVKSARTAVGDVAAACNVTRIASAPRSKWLANLGMALQPEIAQMRGIVIGALLEIAREVVSNQLRKPMERPATGENHDSQPSAEYSESPSG